MPTFPKVGTLSLITVMARLLQSGCAFTSTGVWFYLNSLKQVANRWYWLYQSTDKRFNLSSNHQVQYLDWTHSLKPVLNNRTMDVIDIMRDWMHKNSFCRKKAVSCSNMGGKREISMRLHSNPGPIVLQCIPFYSACFPSFCLSLPHSPFISSFPFLPCLCVS